MGKIEEREMNQYKELESFLREGKGEFRELAVTGENSAVLPTWVSESIVKKMSDTSPIVAQSMMFKTANGSLRIPAEIGNTPAGFFGEGQSVNEESFQLEHLDLEPKRISAAIGITKNVIYDAGVNMLEFVSDKLARKAGDAMELSIFNGDGSETGFHGILNEQGVATVTGSSEPSLIEINNLINAIHPAYQANASFYMNKEYFEKVSNWTDANGRPLLETVVVNGRILRVLFGFPVYQTASIPADQPIVFVNAKDAYALLMRNNATIQRVQADTKQALRGSELIFLDAYMDGKVYNKQAVAKMTVSA